MAAWCEAAAKQAPAQQCTGTGAPIRQGTVGNAEAESGLSTRPAFEVAEEDDGAVVGGKSIDLLVEAAPPFPPYATSR